MDNIEGLGLRKEIDFSKDTLDKLIFQHDRIYFCPDEKSHFILQNLEIERGIYHGSYRVSETKFDRVIHPVYFVKADVLDGQNGTIEGVIRQEVKIFEAQPILKSIPKFSFYYQNKDANCVGNSVQHTTEGLIADIVDVNRRDYRRFRTKYVNSDSGYLPEWFDVSIDPEHGTRILFKI